MIFAPPPPSLAVEGPLSDVVRRLRAAVEAEARFSWDAPETALLLTPDGRLDAGSEYEPSKLEADGFRALLVHFNDTFPRAWSLLSEVRPETAAAVWADLFPRARRDGRVLVTERHRGTAADAAVFGVYPPGFPVEYTVADVAAAVLDGVRAVSAAGAGWRARLRYDAGPSALELVVEAPLYDLVVTASDTYGEPAPTVRVRTRDGRDLGAPDTGPQRRRRPGTGGASTSEGIVAKIQAAPAWYAAKTGAVGATPRPRRVAG